MMVDKNRIETPDYAIPIVTLWQNLLVVVISDLFYHSQVAVSLILKIRY
jgi:hypothetical protein